MLKPKLQYFGHLMGRTHLKRPWCWERLKAGEGDDRGRDRWMASPTHWTWVCVNSGSWWWTGRPGVLQSMGSQRVKHSLVTQQQQIINQTYTCVLAKSLQSCLTLCNSMDYSPPGSSVHGDAPGKNAGVGCHALLQEPNLSGWCHYFFIVTKYT